MNRARSSLPLPVSPSNRIVVSPGAARSACFTASISAALSPTISMNAPAALTCSSRCVTRPRSRCCSWSSAARPRVGDRDGRLRTSAWKLGDLELAGPMIDVEARRVHPNDAEHLVAVDERHGEHRRQRRGVHARDVEPSIIVPHVRHEDRLPARERQPENTGIRGNDHVAKRLTAGAARTHGAKAPAVGVVEEDPARASAECVLERVEDVAAHAIDVHVKRQRFRRADERALTISGVRILRRGRRRDCCVR